MPIETALYVADLVPTNPANSDPVQQGADQIRLIKQTLVSTFPNADAPITATPSQVNSWEGRLAAVEKAAPVGTVYMWLGASAPVDHILLNGGTYLRADYSAFWAAFGPAGANVLGAGNGTTTFTVPDWRLRFPVMAGTGLALGAMGGSQTPAITVASAGAHNHTGSSGVAGSHTHTTQTAGAHTHTGATGSTTLTEAQIPAHTHSGTTDTVGDHSHTLPGQTLKSGPGFQGGSFNAYAGNWTDPAGAHSHGFVTNSTGGGQGHTHTISSDGGHTHTVNASGDHQHTIASDGSHTHTATIADGRPPFFSVNFIVKAR